MKNIYQDKDADIVIEKSYRSSGFPDHKFIKGAKVDALVSLIAQALNASKKVVVFVRNIPVCESLFLNLVEQGFRVNIVHGDKDAKDRRLRIDEFKKGMVDILIATRLLYGRGFDLPQADVAIFYSPKESEAVMWQEMLRIRSTFINLKEVYLLFYAWTTEANKLVRLLNGMIATNSIWLGDRFRWAYSETEIPPFEKRKPFSKSKQSNNQQEKQSITKEFMQSLKQELLILLNQPLKQVRKYLDDLADKLGMTKVWPSAIVRVFISELSSTIGDLTNDKKHGEKWILRTLAKVMHPDKHPNATGIEKEFWHDLFIGLEFN